MIWQGVWVFGIFVCKRNVMEVVCGKLRQLSRNAQKVSPSEYQDLVKMIVLY